MKALNQASIIGNVGQTPEVKHLDSGMIVANLTVATSEKWRDKNGEDQERTEWHRISAFGKLAEIIEKWVAKGDKIFIQGRLETKKWQASDGSDRYTTGIVASDMLMLGGGKQKDNAPAPAPAQSEYDDEGDIPF